LKKGRAGLLKKQEEKVCPDCGTKMEYHQGKGHASKSDLWICPVCGTIQCPEKRHLFDFLKRKAIQ